MKITAAESLHADGGYRTCSYLKLSTDEGLVGWAEYYDSFSGARIDPLIQDFARHAIGMDPRQFGRVSETLLATNGACRYTVQLDDGGTIDRLDFELTRVG